MPKLELIDKIAILADAAKYDASCASSGSVKRNARANGGLGSTEGMGICHAFTPDGRCVSLLKILLTNFCIYDCLYCVNRVSSNVRRARFSVDEIVQLTLDFYRRNYIEGLFLSSGVIQSPDYTMGELARVAKKLRLEHRFQGYIHLKTIPDASPELLAEAGLYADRLSVNIELPTEPGLSQLAPEKNAGTIRQAMNGLKVRIDESKHERKKSRKAPKFSPAGQSTQMIVGADKADDAAIVATSFNLYDSYKLRRVYYSAFSPIPESSKMLPLKSPPLVREHRLYQADWLLRFYGFGVSEIQSGMNDGMLDLDIDPKLAWALKNRDWFPVDVNRASQEMLLRVPGLGARGVQKIIATRRVKRLRLDDLDKLVQSLKKVMPFVCCLDWQPGKKLDDPKLLEQLKPPPKQMDLFA